ncbi:polyamine ABC transporter substrate-binding protein [Agaribacterium haliotis]|uniref:polyamine ABC transporter substrate-binding protein n=1 Tax=Agaribacterium haliotis TaxID=2013869 RepID=UPI0013046E0C|nr:spermidine/putrescine ABC transporter substrate-binding protein [Agaribacterium haliotis]
MPPYNLRHILSLACFCLGCGFCHADTLHILTWEDYLSEKTVNAWEQHSGHSIKQLYFDNDESRDSLLIAPQGQQIDLAIVDENVSNLFGENSAFVAVKDYPELDMLRHIDPQWSERCGAYSTPYLWGTLGLAWRTDKLERKPTSWDSVLRADADTSGHISLLKDAVDSFAPALLSLSEDINTGNRDLLRSAFELTRKALPSVLTFEYPISFLKSEQSKESADKLWLAMAYSGDQHVLNKIAGAQLWAYSVPDEGSILWIDCFAVLSRSRQKALAFDFLNFINRPQINAENSEAIGSPTSNLRAQALQSASFRNDSAIYPPPEIIQRSQLAKPLSHENMQIRSRMASALLKIHSAQ